MGTEVVVPGTGEILDLSELPDDEIAFRLHFIAEVSRDISSFRREVAVELAQRADRANTRTLHAGQWKIEVNAPTEKQWDIDRLLGTLDKFVDEGTITQRAADACTRTKVEPVWGRIKTLLSDPRTAPEISLCFEEVPTTRTASVKR